jgi:peptidylprolyl isomerase
MRELELRARRRRRNTVVGATAGTLAVIGGVIALVLTLVGGDDDKPAAADTLTPTPPATTAPAELPEKCTEISPNPPAKNQPRVPDVEGKPPTELVTKDVKVGKGPAAKNGDTLSVTYIGISCSTGKVFDASYKHGGEPFEVTPLGQASVIAGWNQGLVGVKEGGVRELIIPPDLGYGAQGSPPAIGPNEVLIFLVTVEKVTS